MLSPSFSPARLGAAFTIAGCLLGAVGPPAEQLPIEPLKDSGQNVLPAFEGWYQNEDGTFNLLVGYYNRNMKEALDIPIGPNNKIEPGGPDQGQPTHFLPRRGWGVVSIKVPKDFGDQKLIWTLTANGKTVAIPLGLTNGYQIEPYREAAMGNTPPVIKFTPDGPGLTGPPAPLATAYAVTTTLSEPATLTMWATDKGPPEAPPAAGAAPGPRRPRLSLVLSHYRGPGPVKFADNTPDIDPDGKASTTATFTVPGEYLIRVEGNDSTGVGGGGFQCCWTTAYVRVNVKAAGTGHD